MTCTLYEPTTLISTFLPLVPLAFLYHVAFPVVSAASDIIGTLTLQEYSNTALAGPAFLSKLSSPSFTVSTSAVTGPCSAYLTGTLIFPNPGIYNFTCTFQSTTTGWAWLDGHQICTDGNTYHLEPGRYDNPLWIRRERLVAGVSNGSAVPVRPMPLRVKVMYNGDCEKHPPKFDMQWKRIDANASDENSPHSVTTLIPHLPPVEQRRDALQNSLAEGWGTWLHPNILSIVKLPEGIVVTPQICKLSTGACITAAIPDGRFRKYDVSTRVDLHAWDRSYAQYFVGPGGTKDDVTTYVNANISVEMGAKGMNNQELSLLLTPVSCDGGVDCSDYQVRLEGRYAWFRAGVADAALNGKSIVFASAGLGTVNISTCTTNSAATRSDGKNAILLPFGNAGDAVGAASVVDMTIGQIRLQLDNAKAKEVERLHDTFGTSNAEVAKAIQAAVMWTYVYNPVENGPFLPVSRGWGKNLNNANSDDWIYIIFEWDNFFASVLAGLGNKDISYSNLFQVVKSKTSAGFMPNYFFGGVSTQDRTEPPVGAKVVLELYNKFKDKWMVEVVFDDILDWHEWFLRRRILWPAGLVALGSWNEQRSYAGQGDDDSNSMYAARLESGLDNSPMYDGNFFDNTTSHLMQMYDVGMSSLFVQEAYALADLADTIGRPEGRVLRSRGKIMADKIRRLLWDEPISMYVNKFANGTFYRRISPTSFYAMMANAPSDSQAANMINTWLLNSSRFCVAAGGDFRNNRDDCYWGLPSISYDDPAYLKPGVWNYWRGFVWGPMAMLTYWSLQNYGHVQEVRQGRTALCKQMKALMTRQWSEHRHVCENYNPHKTADTSNGDCSGTPFYHWGALTGLIGLVDEMGDTKSTDSSHINSAFSIL